MQSYLNANFKFTESYVERIVLPDFNLSVGGFLLVFKQMRIANAKFPSAKVYYGDNYGQIEVDGITMQMVFEFTL